VEAFANGVALKAAPPRFEVGYPES